MLSFYSSPSLHGGQANTTTIPGKLKVLIVPHTPLYPGDSLVTIDPAGNIKKTFKYALTFNNGLTLTGSNTQLGGSLTQATTISSNGFELFINQINPANNILNYQFNGTTVGFINTFGNMYLSAVGASSNPNDAVITLNASGIIAARNQADNVAVMRVKNNNIGSTGDILDIQNIFRTVLFTSVQGGIIHAPMVSSSAGVGSCVRYDRWTLYPLPIMMF